MGDDLQDRGSPDRKRVSLGEQHEVRYWTARFAASEDELRRTLEKVGNSVTAIENKLRPN